MIQVKVEDEEVFSVIYLCIYITSKMVKGG